VFLFFWGAFGYRLYTLGSSGMPVESASVVGNSGVGEPDRKGVGFSKDSCGTFLDSAVSVIFRFTGLTFCSGFF